MAVSVTALWIGVEILAVLAVAGIFTASVFWRDLRKADKLLLRYHAELTRLRQREKDAKAARPAPAPVSNSDAALVHLKQELAFCDLRAIALPHDNSTLSALTNRSHALRAEVLALETRLQQEAALPVVLPAYSHAPSSLPAATPKELIQLRHRINEADIEIARLTTLETLYHNLREAVSSNASRGLQIASELKQGLDSPAIPGEYRAELDALQSSYSEVQSLTAASTNAPIIISPELRKTFEEGDRLHAAYLMGKPGTGALRASLQELLAATDREEWLYENSSGCPLDMRV